MGSAVRAYPSLAESLGPLAAVAWPWYVLIGTTITVLVGMLSSFSHPEPVPAAAAPLREAA